MGGRLAERYERAMEYGCVDFRLLPDERLRKYYAQYAARGGTCHILDMRGFSMPLRREISSAILACWDRGGSEEQRHKYILSVRMCVKALEGFDRGSFADLSDEEASEISGGDRYLARALGLLMGPGNGRDAEDVWRVEDLGMPPERINATHVVSTISFAGVLNEANKSELKAYVKHCVATTALVINSICDRLSKLREFDAFLGGDPFDEVTRGDIAAYERLCLSRTTAKSSSTKMYAIKGFYTWLHEEGRIAENPFSGYVVTGDNSRRIRTTAPSDYVIAQVGRVLPSLPIDQSLQYLILKCTGMRVSDLCMLRKGCLEKTPEGNCFIRFWCQKMAKDVENVIPPSLYDLVEDYISLLPEGQEYLFRNSKDAGRPAQASTVVSRLARSLAAEGVVGDDGEPYSFTPHSMRHKMAVQLIEAGVPYSTMQEQLHHASPEMTTSYTEFDMERRVAKAARFYDSEGREAPVFIATSEEIAENKVDLIMERLNAQILPNGICSRPVALGECKKCNACLDCPDFRTSVDFLDVHAEQLGRTRAFVEAAEKAGWTAQAESARKLERKLERIIKKIGG